uniref:Uncharacterized protein n=1 Tax=Anguilla anguilla TaxID=7936 RepID=A0A0E9R6N9_ANGAN
MLQSPQTICIPIRYFPTPANQNITFTHKIDIFFTKNLFQFSPHIFYGIQVRTL